MNKAVYYINDSLNDWQLYRNNIPNTTITDIEVNNVENHVLISTYGRGIWRSATVPEALLDIETISSHRPNIVLFPNPVQNISHINTSIKEPSVLKVFAASGTVVLTKEFNEINPQTDLDFSSLASGVYFMTLTSATHLISKKFVKD
jgi:hypothetical protein